MKLCIVYLASPRDKMYIREDTGYSITRLESLNKSIKITRSIFPDVDIIVFHEDLLYTDLPHYVKLEKVNFSGLEHHYTKCKHSYGYLMMCRFFTGVMQAHPVVQKYTHYMRLDDDSFFINPFGSILTNDILDNDYCYRTIFTEEGSCQTRIYDFTKNFILERGLQFNEFDKQKAPYNNFHISSLSLWRHPLVREYINALETDQLILRDDILDANIHACIIWGILPNTTLKSKEINTFGYRHNYHVCLVNSSSILFMDNIQFCPQNDVIEDVGTQPILSVNKQKRFVWNKYF
jgi:hypothetical protein